MKIWSELLQGSNFEDIYKTLQPEHVIALCSLIASIQRPTGLWRLQEVMDEILIIYTFLATYVNWKITENRENRGEIDD